MSHGSRSRSQSDPTHWSFASTKIAAIGHGRRQTGPHSSRDQDFTLVIDEIGEHPVAGGASSDVWKAKMMRDGRPILVAYKVLRLMGRDPVRLRQKLAQEAASWKPLDHVNIATFYGVHYQANGPTAIVSQWYDNGSADVYLRRHRDDPDVNPLTIILEIAAGIEYLHDKRRIVHGDIKGANIMIDDGGHAKLIDFGLAHLIDSDEGLTTSLAFSIRWCAPELLDQDARTTQASDVYAFASTVLELLTGQVPYSGLNDIIVTLEVIRGVTPRMLETGLPNSILRSKELQAVLETCWDETSCRPSIHEVGLYLRHLYC